jgi:ribosomal protein S18 acetylase RimI-like enzyme
LTIQLTRPESEHDWREARRLIEEYAASLPVDLSFQNFAHELDHLAGEYASPDGAFLLAEENGAYLGCVGLRRLDENTGEIKRLYVTPAAQGRGVGRMLAQGIVAAARDTGYACLLLDTLPSMRQAQRLYESMGFKSTAAYRFNPVPGTAFLKLEIR